MEGRQQITSDEARAIGVRLGLDWAKVSLEQFRRGIEVELEHGAQDPETDITHDDLALTGRIAWAHLKGIRDYYTRLDRLEAEAHAEMSGLWPLLGSSTDHTSPPAPDRASPDGPAPAFSSGLGGLFSRLLRGAGESDEDLRRGHAHTREASGGDLFTLMIDG